MKPKITIKLEKEEYYEGETIQGSVNLKFERNFKDFSVLISLIYEEHYVMFNDNGDTALKSKDFKLKLFNLEL